MKGIHRCIFCIEHSGAVSFSDKLIYVADTHIGGGVHDVAVGRTARIKMLNRPIPQTACTESRHVPGALRVKCHTISNLFFGISVEFSTRSLANTTRVTGWGQEFDQP